MQPRPEASSNAGFSASSESASLPSPITNGQVNGYEVDFHWPDKKLIVAGWEVIRITWRQLRDEPERVVALLRAKLCGL